MENFVPNSIVLGISGRNLKNKAYLKDLDFVREHMECNMVHTPPGSGFWNEHYEQSLPIIKEFVDHAHEIGLKVAYRMYASPGFPNAGVTAPEGMPKEVDQVKLFPIANPQESDALAQDYEVVSDEEGYAEFSHAARWSRDKIGPIFNRLLKIYSFEKTREGFYKKGSLTDITDHARIVRTIPSEMSCEIYGGKENANKTFFAIVAQHYNYTETGEPQWRLLKKCIDEFKEIPFDGIYLDEFSMSYLSIGINKGTEPPFRARRYSEGMRKHYQENLGIDLGRLLFDMRYAPEGEENVRIKAINLYFEQLRRFPLIVEKKVAEYAKEVFGQNTYIGVHNTFHNNLDKDEIWHTACTWWDVPRDYGHTDENISMPVRMGVMLAAKNPLMFDMFYSRRAEAHYEHIVVGAPFGSREIHHAFGDKVWGQSFMEPEFLKKISLLDRAVSKLNSFQTEYPKLDLLVIFGSSAQNNWYPDREARNIWDINGSLNILPKCDIMWNAGYRCALVPDYAIEDGRIRLDGDRILFNGHSFTHCLFLYPRYAKKETYEFLNKAGKDGLKVAAVGKADMDFDGDPAVLTVPCTEEFDLSVLEQMGCPKGAIPGGSVYTDGSFAFMGQELLTGEKQDFDFWVNGDHVSGEHTGLLAYRQGEHAFATPGSKLVINGNEVELSECTFAEEE